MREWEGRRGGEKLSDKKKIERGESKFYITFIKFLFKKIGKKLKKNWKKSKKIGKKSKKIGKKSKKN